MTITKTVFAFSLSLSLMPWIYPGVRSSLCFHNRSIDLCSSFIFGIGIPPSNICSAISTHGHTVILNIVFLVKVAEENFHETFRSNWFLNKPYLYTYLLHCFVLRYYWQDAEQA
jgi:hypothetical protein